MKYLVLLFFMFGSFVVCGQDDKSESVEMPSKDIKNIAYILDSLVANRNFTFIANYAIPAGGSNISVASEYKCEIQNDSIFCFLPYFGRAYQINLSEDGGVKFETRIKEYTLTTRKNQYQIEIEVKTEFDLYKLFFVIWNNGRASLSVNSGNKQNIQYEGVIEGLGH